VVTPSYPRRFRSFNHPGGYASEVIERVTAKTSPTAKANNHLFKGLVSFPDNIFGTSFSAFAYLAFACQICPL
jgi:hypothetical protein